MIEPGETIPSISVRLVEAAGTTETTTAAVLGDGLVVFFTVPGAFTPTCHVNHLPGFLANAAKLRVAGVAHIVCGAVNDHHVLRAWGEATAAFGSVSFIADAKAEFAAALGLSRETGDLGVRFRRSAMIIRDGRVEAVFVEDKPGVTATGAPAILMALETMNAGAAE